MRAMSPVSRRNRETNAHISAGGVPEESWGHNKIDPRVAGSSPS